MKKKLQKKNKLSSKTPNRGARKSLKPALKRKSKTVRPQARNKQISLPKPITFHPVNQHSETLPYSYDQTLLVLMVRDPYWVYGYWDFSSQTWNWVQDFLRREPTSQTVLRVHNLERGDFTDLDVRLEAKNWYLNVGEPNTSFEAELGFIDSTGRFHLIVKSNRIRTPRDTPSEVIDKNWDAGDFDEIYQLSGGGRTGKGSELFSPVRKPL
ncbi:MAG: DUF4912 domain-containing protein [Candidatus Omnitrophica bacterium]|nr:DUF4912 domain-containing protein [Candidatus Omnitrophota bacterium]